jgi:hypothetical protein
MVAHSATRFRDERAVWSRVSTGPAGFMRSVVRCAISQTAVHTYRARDRLGDAVRDPDLPHTMSGEHPVLWRHPATGTPILYVNP